MRLIKVFIFNALQCRGLCECDDFIFRVKYSRLCELFAENQLTVSWCSER